MTPLVGIILVAMCVAKMLGARGHEMQQGIGVNNTLPTHAPIVYSDVYSNLKIKNSLISLAELESIIISDSS